LPSAKDIKIETNRDGSRIHVFFTLESKDQAEKLQKQKMDATTEFKKQKDQGVESRGPSIQEDGLEYTVFL
jgi:hypothetical protein